MLTSKNRVGFPTVPYLKDTIFTTNLQEYFGAALLGVKLQIQINFLTLS